MRRIVIVPIHVDQATKASVLLQVGVRSTMFNSEYAIDLAHANQLARDLRDITTFAIGMADMLDERGPTNPERSGAIRASVARLRATAGLDNE